MIFDRGGLTSMSMSTQYLNFFVRGLIMSVMNPECRCLLLTFDFDETLHKGKYQIVKGVVL